MKAPATLDEFYRTFPTEQRCWEALRRPAVARTPEVLGPAHDALPRHARPATHVVPAIFY
jgi:hypothetical protein